MDSSKYDATEEEVVKRQCEQDWRRLRILQLELQNIVPAAINIENSASGASATYSKTDSDNTSQSSRLQILHELEKRLKAELEVLREELKTLPENASHQLLIFEQDQVKSLDHLKDSLIHVRAIREEILEDIKQEEKSHNSLSRLNEVLKEKIAAVDQVTAANKAGRTVESVLAEMTTKVEKVTERNKYFKDKLKEILTKYFPLSHHKVDEGILGKSTYDGVGNTLSMKDIIGRLIEQSLNSREQPYIDIDEKFWPPHVEFLLRCQIVLKDPQNSHRMKLVPFHL